MPQLVKKQWGKSEEMPCRFAYFFGSTARESCRKKLPEKKISSNFKVHGTEKAVSQQE